MKQMLKSNVKRCEIKTPTGTHVIEVRDEEAIARYGLRVNPPVKVTLEFDAKECQR